MNVPQSQPISSNNNPLPKAVTDSVNATTNAASNVATTISNNVSNAGEYVSDSIKSFGDANLVGSTTSFLESNTLVAKFAFILFVLIIFMILLNLGVKLVGYFMKPNGDPKLVNGTMNGANEVTIYQDPKNSESISILRSNNQDKGAEFTWSLWLYINDTFSKPKYSHVFNKGNATFNEEGLATVNNGPGLYIDNEENNLVILMNTVTVTNPEEMVIVKDVPLRKWFHCIIRLENNVVDVYINGGIVNRTLLQDVPKQNYQNVNICKNGGFNGNLADLRYYDKALSVFQINNIVAWGRNKNAANSNASNDASDFPYYLSNLWYSYNY
jgi:hypothetical protein